MKKDFSKIKLFAMDVDGTLTDGKIYIGNDGEVMKAFNAKDGLGIKLLIKKGIVPIIITGRRSKIVTRYIGDDMNDLSAMQTAGITFAPADCAAALLPYVDFVLTQKSGDAPVREAIDIILENRLTLSDYASI